MKKSIGLNKTLLGRATILGFVLLISSSAAQDSTALVPGATVQQVFIAPLKPLFSMDCPSDDPCPPEPPDPACVPAPCLVDFGITNIELTQAVQCLDSTEGDRYDTEVGCTEDNQVPLVLGKPLLIRVYVNKEAGEIPLGFRIAMVTLHLKVTRPETGKTIISEDRSTFVFAIESPAREDLGHSANFVFLCGKCQNQDVLAVNADIAPLPDAMDTFGGNNVFPATGFLERPLNATRPLVIEYHQVQLEDGRIPATGILLDQHLYIQNAFPVPSVSYRLVPPIKLDSLELFDLFKRINVSWLVRVVSCGIPGLGCDIPDQIVAWAPPESLGNAISDPLYLPTLGGYGVATVVDSIWTFPGSLGPMGFKPSRGSPTLAHEIGHNLGRNHPCGFAGVQDVRWPYVPPKYASDRVGTTGQEASFRTQELGIRIFDSTGTGTQQALSGKLLDFMIGHHCRGFSLTPSTAQLVDGARPEGVFNPDIQKNDNWLSPYTYHNLFCAQSLEPSGSLLSRLGLVSALGTCLIIVQPPPAPAPNVVAIVSGTVNPQGGGSINSIYRIPNRRPPPQVEPGPACLKLVRQGHISSQKCFRISFDLVDTVPSPPDASRPAGFTQVLPWVQGATHLILERNNVEIASIPLSGAPLDVQFISPAGPDLLTGRQRVQWQAFAGDRDLTFALFYSPDGDRHDGRRRLVPLAVDMTDRFLHVNMNKLPGGDLAFFRLFATDNQGQTTIVDSPQFAVPKKPPRVSIINPQRGSQFLIGDAILFRGQVDDLEDARLPPRAFQWFSDVDGPLPLGPAIGTTSLSQGRHRITLTVTDSDGQTGQAHIRVKIVTQLAVQPNTTAPEDFE